MAGSSVTVFLVIVIFSIFAAGAVAAFQSLDQLIQEELENDRPDRLWADDEKVAA